MNEAEGRTKNKIKYNNTKNKLGTILNDFFSPKIRQTPKIIPLPFYIVTTEKFTVYHSNPYTVSVFGVVNFMI